MFLLYFFCNRILSYFAEPNFINYDEWFDDDLEKTRLDIKNKKIKTTENLHEFFYELSNHKIGASENNMQLDIKSNKKELITNNYLANNYLDNISESYSPLPNNKFKLFKKFTKSKLKFNITKKLLYSLSILSVLLIFGFLIFFIFKI
tara:strand:+ start:41 stop:484 length:444 start_codon:yes stop_codon:yes gene_type:complete